MLFVPIQNVSQGRYVTYGLSIWDNGTLSEMTEKLLKGFQITPADLLRVFEKRIYQPLINMGDGEPGSSEPPTKIRKQPQFQPDGLIRIAVLPQRCCKRLKMEHQQVVLKVL